jgi:hypothetical protein
MGGGAAVLRDDTEDIVTDFIKIASVFAFLSAFFSIPMVVAAAFDHSSEMGVMWFGILCYACFIGFLLRMLFYGFEVTHSVMARIVLFILGAAMTAAIVCARLFTVMFAAAPISEIVTVAVLFIIAYFLGLRFYVTSYRRIMTKNVFALGVGFNVFAVIVLWIVKKPFSVTVCAFVVLVAGSLFAMINNQGHIDYLMERRRHGMKYLPKKIRSYNVSLISLLCGLFALGFVFRAYVADFLGAVLDFLTRFFAYVFAGLLWLFEKAGALLGGDDEAAPAGGFEDLSAFLEPSEESKFGIIAVYAVYTALIAAIVFTVFRKRQKIKAWFSAVCRKILAFLRTVFKALPFKKRDNVVYDYYDVEEFITREEIARSKKTNPEKERRNAVKHWKRRFSQYRKMDGDSVKYRFGYRLAYDGYRLCGKTVENYHTPNEVAAVVGKPAFDRVKDSYNYIRYAESDMGSDLPALNKTLQEIMQAL